MGDDPAALFNEALAKAGEPAPTTKRNRLLADLCADLSDQELLAILQSHKGSRIEPKRYEWSEAYCKFGVFSDSHMGHKGFREAWLYRAYDLFEREKCSLALHPGDIAEGMSGRPGHVYELTHVGYHQQFRYARDRLAECPVPIKAIAGNHDLWFYEKSDIGVLIGQELEDALGKAQFEYLGEHEGDVYLNDLWVKLWHGKDGKAYAKSYRGQKIVESFRGGEKPHILLLGHAHDSIDFSARNVRVLECGTLSSQSDFMRYTKKEATPGIYIVETWGRGSLERFRCEWVPFYD